MKNIKNDFNEYGFCIVRNLISEKEHKDIFFLFYDVSISIIYRYNIKTKFSLKPLNKLKYPEDVQVLDKLILTILKKDKKLIGELYDTISYSWAFLKFFSGDKFEKITKNLLGLEKYNSIYSWTHRVRIDPPFDNRRTYGWHQEVFYTIPNTRFLQTWCPIIRNTSIRNGTIEICPRSHSKGIAKQKWNEISGRATQILIDKKEVNKFTQKSIPMKIGDVMFFDPHLFHRSGNNTTASQVRFSLVGMWNDTNFKNFKPPKPNFISRTISPKENFKNHFKN